MGVRDRSGCHVEGLFPLDAGRAPGAECFPLHFEYCGWKQLQDRISGRKVSIAEWRSRTIYRACSEDDEIVHLFWEYVAECETHSYQQLRMLFQWFTGWACSPGTDWKFQIHVVDDASQLVAGRERLPAMVLCMTDDDSYENRGVKTPTLYLPKYADRWEFQAEGGCGWRPFESEGAPIINGEVSATATLCTEAAGVKYRITLSSQDQGVAEELDGGGAPGEKYAIRLITAKATLEQKMWWAVRGGHTMDGE